MIREEAARPRRGLRLAGRMDELAMRDSGQDKKRRGRPDDAGLELDVGCRLVAGCSSLQLLRMDCRDSFFFMQMQGRYFRYLRGQQDNLGRQGRALGFRAWCRILNPCQSMAACNVSVPTPHPTSTTHPHCDFPPSREHPSMCPRLWYVLKYIEV